MHAYDRIALKTQLSPLEWAQYSQWIRFDARLGEMMLKYLHQSWDSIHPLKLHEAILKMRDPQVFGVLCEQTYLFAIWKDSTEKKLFKNWAKLVMSNIQAAPYSQFYVGLNSPASKSMLKNAQYSLKFYRKWGFAGRDIWINKLTKTNQTTLDKDSRSMILNELIETRRKHEPHFIRVEDYLEAVEFMISRRMAEIELKQHPKLQPYGQTRSKIYLLK